MKTHANNFKESIADWDKYDEVGIGVGSYTDMEILQRYSVGRVLDAGCGRGKFIASFQNRERYGIDMSARAIETAKNTYPEVNFQVGSVTRIPFPEHFFDFVYSLEVIEHVREYENMIREMVRVIKPGGYIFIQTPNYPVKRLYDIVYWLRGKRSFKDDYTHVSKFSFCGLKKMMSKHAQIVDIKTRNIMLEKHLPFLTRLRRSGSVISLLIGQKTIIVAKKI